MIEQDRVPVRLSIFHLSGSNGAACAADIGNDHRLAEFLLQILAENTGIAVRVSARAGRDHHSNGLLGPVDFLCAFCFVPRLLVIVVCGGSIGPATGQCDNQSHCQGKQSKFRALFHLFSSSILDTLPNLSLDLDRHIAAIMLLCS